MSKLSANITDSIIHLQDAESKLQTEIDAMESEIEQMEESEEKLHLYLSCKTLKEAKLAIDEASTHLESLE